MKQHVHHGWTTNIDVDFGRQKEYVRLCLYGKYDHCEMLTYGADHSRLTIIIHYKVSYKMMKKNPPIE